MWIFKNHFFLFLVLLFDFGSLFPVLINKAFYHRGNCEDKIVFYFDQTPKIKRSEVAGKIIYEFANMQIDPTVQPSLNEISKQAQKYQVNFSHQKQRLILNIDFNKQPGYKISAAQFKPISQPAGLVIKIWYDMPQTTTPKQSKSCKRLAKPQEIVLDFGHGGNDTGAMFGKICEKDIVRSVGLKLAKLLKKQGYVVHLTRIGDEFVSLDDRTYFANLKTGASLFISLHANHAPNTAISGLETYHMSDLLFSSFDDHFASNNSKRLNFHSATLANLVHANILQSQNQTSKIKLVDRKVKQSVSQVLLGVEMPAILIELGFMSNPKEARQLNSPKYQNQLATGIYNGIMAYALQL